MNVKSKLLFCVCAVLLLFVFASCSNTPSNVPLQTSGTDGIVSDTVGLDTEPVSDADSDPLQTTTIKEKEIVQPENEKSIAVMVNQLGYLTNSDKIAYVTGGGRTFDVVNASTGEIVYSGLVEKGGYAPTSDDDVNYCDFTDFKTPGTYYIWVNQELFSYTFKIGDDVYDSFVKDLIKTIFYQRCGYTLPEGFEDPYMHDACHTGAHNYVEQKAQGLEVPYEQDVTGGWHDAGDFSVQGVSNSLTASLLMYAYKLYPEYTSSDDLGIPESGNGIPDILDEARWGVEWLIKTQGEDGRAIRRNDFWGQPPITTRADEHTSTAYVFPGSFGDTGNSVATCALAARVFKDIDPEFAEKCLDCAKRGYEWMLNNTDFVYPDTVVTYYGNTEYTGASQKDEFIWAKAELYATTKDKSYLDDMLFLTSTEDLTGIGYHDRGGMAILSLITEGEEGWDVDAAYNIKQATKKQARTWVDYADENKWNVIADNELHLWHYNLNSHFAKATMTMIFAEMVDTTGKIDYTKYIAGSTNFIFGANPLNFCFVTGYGTVSVQYPHHRNAALGNMFPGWVAPGPGSFTSVSQTHKDLASYVPKDTPLLKCYYDKTEYYRFNEWTVDQSTWHLISVLALIADNDK